MSRFVFSRSMIFASTAVVALSAAGAWAQAAGTPDFGQADGAAWIAMSQDYIDVPNSPKTVSNDPKYPFVPNGRGAQPTFRIADAANPNLKPWAAEQMRRENDAILKGGIAYTARSSCMHGNLRERRRHVVEIGEQKGALVAFDHLVRLALGEVQVAETRVEIAAPRPDCGRAQDEFARGFVFLPAGVDQPEQVEGIRVYRI